mgnify:CR=1 FL=1
MTVWLIGMACSLAVADRGARERLAGRGIHTVVKPSKDEEVGLDYFAKRKWNLRAIDEDVAAVQTPLHHKCSVCVGVGTLLHDAFQRRERPTRSSPSGAQARVLTIYEVHDAIEEACLGGNMLLYGVMQKRSGGRPWLHGPGLVHLDHLRGVPKVSNRVTKGWVMDACHAYASAEETWGEGGSYGGLYRTFWRGLRDGVGTQYFLAHLCVLKMKACTLDEVSEIVTPSSTEAKKTTLRKKKTKKKKKKRRSRASAPHGGGLDDEYDDDDEL